MRTTLFLVLVSATTSCLDAYDDPPAATPAPLASSTGEAPIPGDDWRGERWPGGVVPYYVDDGNPDNWVSSVCLDGADDGAESSALTAGQKRAVTASIDLVNELLAPQVHFVLKSASAGPPPTTPFLVYRNLPPSHSGSSARVRGVPRDGLANCVWLIPSRAGTEESSGVTDDNYEGRRRVTHETLHVLGADHEQQRPDRADWLELDWTCHGDAPAGPDDLGIIDGMDPDAVLVTPYDVTSIMQYDSANGCGAGPGRFCGAFSACRRPVWVAKGVCTASELSVPVPQTVPCWIHVPKIMSRHDVNGLFRLYEKPLAARTPNDDLGVAMATGDFDDDGYYDLAVGAPGYHGSGAVFLFRGTAGTTSQTSYGKRLVPWRVLTEADFGGPLPHARFGASLASGDFDGDGDTDLAVGAPVTDSDPGDGRVFLYEDVTIDGPAPLPAPDIERNSLRPGEVIQENVAIAGFPQTGDRFGVALDAADFDGDGVDDLAIGAPGLRVSGVRGGAVIVRHMGPLAVVDTYTELSAASVPEGHVVAGARFGASVRGAKLDANRPAWLIVGSPESGITNGTGAVYTFEPVFNVSLVGKQILRPNDADAAGSRFGAELAVGDLQGNGLQLVVGAPWHKSRVLTLTVPETGALYRIPRNTAVPSLFMGNALPIFDALPVSGNHFGSVLRARRSPGADRATLYVGVPEANGGVGKVVTLRFGNGATPTVTRALLDTPWLVNTAPDRFGSAFEVGNFIADASDEPGQTELVVGASGSGAKAGAFWLRNFDPVYSAPFVLDRWRAYDESTATPD